jgi:hypothetical protein
MYIPLTTSSLVFSLLSVLYMIADHGYDAKKLYKYSQSIWNKSSLPSVERYEITSKKRIDLVYFYQSVLGQTSTARDGYR